MGWNPLMNYVDMLIRCGEVCMLGRLDNISHTYHEKKFFYKKTLDSNGKNIVYYTMLKRAQMF